MSETPTRPVDPDRPVPATPPPKQEADKFEKRSLIKSVMLPSRGLLYGDQLPDGMVRVAAFTTRDEKVFSGGGETAEAKIDHVMRHCVDTGSLSPDELLVGDSLFCLFWARALSYGQKYGFQIRCSECGAQRRYEINLPQDLPLYEAPDDYHEPFDIDLPIRKLTLSLRVFRRRDENAISRQTEEAGQKRVEEGDPGYYLRLARHIVAIDGERPSPLAAMELVQNLEGPDSLAMRNALDDNAYGYGMDLDVKCRNCGYVNETEMPMSAEFFRPRSGRRVRGVVAG